MEADKNGFARRFVIAQLISDAFVNDDVGVDCHTNRQDDTGDTGHRQGGAHRSHTRHDEYDIAQERKRSDETATAIIDAHEEEDEHEADRQRFHTRFNRVHTERRTDERFVFLANRSGQRTRTERNDEVVDFIERLLAIATPHFDRNVAAGDFTTNDRIAD